MADEKPAAAPMWKRFFATFLDVMTSFFAFGWVIGAITGNLQPGGFSLNGPPAFALFAAIIAYFFIGRRLVGGTVWDRVFGIARPQP